MKRVITRGAYALAGAAVLAIALYVAFWVAGSAIVIDKGGHVASAVVVNSGTSTQNLSRLPFGIFYAVPQIEGTIEVRCRDGSRKQLGYVTGNIHTWLRVDPDVGCARITYVS